MALPPLPDPLAGRLSSLPLILAGPILRRVQEGEVTVWLALKESSSVTLRILDANEQTLWSVQKNTLPVGTNLHVLAITARITAPRRLLMPGEILYYDLLFGQKRLDDAGILAAEGGSDTLAKYVAYRADGRPLRPAFSLPPASLKDLKIAHGSCRKPHSPSLDALRTLDFLLGQAEPPPAQVVAHDPIRRQHQLFLTGDQIYADDVADVLLRLLTDAGDTLLGQLEQVPGLRGPARFPKDFPPALRANIVEFMADANLNAGGGGFTSGENRSHLLGLGEFLSMYLFLWSDALWPAALPNYEIVYDAEFQRPTRLDFERQRFAVQNFRRWLPRVRRVLANIPTYMVFDDHEITDDWYMHRLWAGRTFGKPLATRIIQNGLIAYALCQAWGNTPEEFDSTKPGHALLTNVNTWIETGFDPSSDAHTEIRRRLPLPTQALRPNQQDAAIIHTDDQLPFYYRIRWATHEVIALDTRTWRSYRRDSDTLVALLTPAAVEKQLGNLQKLPSGAITIVLLPGPLFVPPQFDYILGSITRTEGMTYFTDGRLEGMSQETFSLENFLSRLAYRMVDAGQPKDQWVVVLSGDVHFGMSSHFHYWAKHPLGGSGNDPARLVIANLTSSGLKHQVPLTLELHKRGFKLGEGIPEDVMRLSWDLAETDLSNKKYEVANIVQILPRGGQVNTRLTAPVDQRSRTATIMDRNEERRSRAIISATFNPPPHRISVLRFIPSELERIAEKNIREINSLPTGDRRARLAVFLRDQKVNEIDKIEVSTPGKQLTGLHNVGTITFADVGTSNPKVVQELWWWFDDGVLLLEGEENLRREVLAFPLSRHTVPLAFLAEPGVDF